MRKLQAILPLLLAIIWLPVTSHCLLLEATTNVASRSGGEHDGPGAGHEDECAADSCDVVEGAQYQSSLQRLTIPPLSPRIAFELPDLLAPELTSLRIAVPESDELLMCFAVKWRFSTRTALPSRAPTLTS